MPHPKAYTTDGQKYVVVVEDQPLVEAVILFLGIVRGIGACHHDMGRRGWVRSIALLTEWRGRCVS